MAFENLIIRARSVTKSYGSEIVLSDFNLDVWNGSIVGILGISGSGKIYTDKNVVASIRSHTRTGFVRRH